MPSKAALIEKLRHQQEKEIKDAMREAKKQITVVRNEYKTKLIAMHAEYKKNKANAQNENEIKKLKDEYYKNSDKLEREGMRMIKKAEANVDRAAVKKYKEIAPRYEKLIKT